MPHLGVARRKGRPNPAKLVRVHPPPQVMVRVAGAAKPERSGLTWGVRRVEVGDPAHDGRRLQPRADVVALELELPVVVQQPEEADVHGRCHEELLVPPPPDHGEHDPVHGL
eukprot:15447596-Alexandrium_andersonii.AAC.1